LVRAGLGVEAVLEPVLEAVLVCEECEPRIVVVHEPEREREGT